MRALTQFEDGLEYTFSERTSSCATGAFLRRLSGREANRGIRALTLFQELKRRGVIKVSIAYVAIAWLTLQVADVLLNNLGGPRWVFKVILLLLAIGFPVTVFLSWIFDWTPGGFQRTDQLPTAGEAAERNIGLVPHKASVAVLPFVNMSGNPDNEYFSDGLTEELLNVLAKIKPLKVAARTSSFHFKGQTGDIAEIGRRLAVAAVLEGSVRQSGSRVRISAQLINVSDGYHLWSETFDRELDDIFAVQDEISSSVAHALELRLVDTDTDQAALGGTTNTDAFQAYLLAVHYRNRGDNEDTLRAAIDAFNNAIELDPRYAKAYLGLARAWSQMAANDFVGYGEGTDHMEAAVNRALEVAPRLAEGHLALGLLRFVHKQDLQGARKAFDTALELNPGAVDIQIEYSRIQCYRGHFEESIAAARRALELDPVSLFANLWLGHILYFSRRYDEAIPALRNTLAMDPDYPKPHYFIAMSVFWQGKTEAAWEEIQQEPLRWMKCTASAIILHRLGRRQEAEASLAELDIYHATIQQADTYAQWGETELAFKALDLAFECRDPGLSQLLVDPCVDPIRDDPRFARMLNRLGFEPDKVRAMSPT